jgi:hypothetical protein
LSERYGLPVEEARRFYREIIDGIRISSRPGPKNDPLPARPADTEVFNTRKFRSRHYLVNGKPVTISYGSQELEHYIHRPLAWLETANPAEDSLHLRAVKYGHSSVPKKQGQASKTRCVLLPSHGQQKTRLHQALNMHCRQMEIRRIILMMPDF